MDDIERTVDDGVNTFKSLTKDGRFVPGAGATEIELAKQLSSYAEVRGKRRRGEGGKRMKEREWEGKRSKERGGEGKGRGGKRMKVRGGEGKRREEKGGEGRGGEGRGKGGERRGGEGKRRRGKDK